MAESDRHSTSSYSPLGQPRGSQYDGLNSDDEELPEEDEGIAFLEGDRFQGFIGLVIFMNVLVLWGETDNPGLLLWSLCDNTFLVIFIIEIIARLIYFRPERFFFGADKWWGYLDLSIVCLGIVDLWLTPLFFHSQSSPILRFLRLMRLLRLLRLFHMFAEMRKFADALVGMGMKFVWIFVVLSLLIVCTAIALTHLLGHAEALGGQEQVETEWADEFDDINSHFGDVGTSAFTLFQITTADNWGTIGVSIIKIDPRWRAFFYIFIMFASWTMISVLTAVASNSMFETTTAGKEQDHLTEERNRMKFVTFLRDSFIDADVDGNGILDKEEFDALLEKEFVHEQMRALGIHLPRGELEEAWRTLDYDESGELTIDAFVDGLSFLQEGLGTKHIVNVDYSMKRVHTKVKARMDKCKFSLMELVEENQEVVDKLKAQGASQHQQQLSFWLWQQWSQRSNYNRHKAREEGGLQNQASLQTRQTAQRQGSSS